jgi:hypothetical protein
LPEQVEAEKAMLFRSGFKGGWEKKEAELDLKKLKLRQIKSMNLFNIVRFKTPECSANDTTIAIGSLTGFYFCRLAGTAKVPWHQ